MSIIAISLLLTAHTVDAFIANGRHWSRQPLKVTPKASSMSTTEFLELAAATDRGQSASTEEMAMAEDFVQSLESCSGKKCLDGEWKLVFGSEAPYRSSPFFWGFRQLCDGLESPVLAASFAEAVFQITDGIPFKKIASAKQIISGSENPGGVLKSEVTIEVSIFDALVPKAQSIMTTTAATTPLYDNSHTIELALQKTEVKDSTLSKVPGFGFIDDIEFPTTRIFDQVEQFRGSSTGRTSIVEMRSILFEDGNMRVSFPPGDDIFFVWVRTRNAAESVARWANAKSESGDEGREEEDAVVEAPSDVE